MKLNKLKLKLKNLMPVTTGCMNEKLRQKKVMYKHNRQFLLKDIAGLKKGIKLALEMKPEHLDNTGTFNAHMRNTLEKLLEEVDQ